MCWLHYSGFKQRPHQWEKTLGHLAAALLAVCFSRQEKSWRHINFFCSFSLTGRGISTNTLICNRIVIPQGPNQTQTYLKADQSLSGLRRKENIKHYSCDDISVFSSSLCVASSIFGHFEHDDLSLQCLAWRQAFMSCPDYLSCPSLVAAHTWPEISCVITCWLPFTCEAVTSKAKQGGMEEDSDSFPSSELCCEPHISQT